MTDINYRENRMSPLEMILDNAKLFSKTESSYNELKKRIVALNLKPDEYEKAIEKLRRIMEV